MDTQNRLRALAIQVKMQRQNSYISNWSEEIKKEAVFLMGEVGISELVISTQLPRSLVYVWRDKFKKNKVKINLTENKNEKIFVTRITSNNEIFSKNEKIIASIERNGCIFKFYCKNTSIEILERLLLK